MITARREGTLAYYLSDLAQRRNDIGVPLLENYQVCFFFIILDTHCFLNKKGLKLGLTNFWKK